jgi:hypothetical protein
MRPAASTEAWVEELVVARTKIPGGPWFVELRGMPSSPVFLGPYSNPAVAKEVAGEVRRFLADVLRSGRVNPASTADKS